MKPTLLVLAAGMGSRFGGDKQIAAVGPNGEYLLDYSLFDAWRAGFGAAVLVIRPELEEPLTQHFGHRWDDKLKISFVEQRLDDLPGNYKCPAGRTKPWGTGHAIWCARHSVSGAFAAINADDFYGAKTFRLLADHIAKGGCTDAEYAMVGFELRKTLSEHGTVSRGICRCNAAGLLQTIVETMNVAPEPNGAASCDDPETGKRKMLTGNDVVSMNFWGFPRSIFRHLDSQLREFLDAHGQEPKSEFYIPVVVDRLIHEGMVRVPVLSSPEKWFGMTYLEDRPVVTEHFRKLTESGFYQF